MLSPIQRRLGRFSILLLGGLLVAGLLSALAISVQPQAEEAAAAEQAASADRLSRELLDEGISLARQNLLAVQRPRGDFVYEFDFITDEETDENHAVRQAGGLWALSLLHEDAPTDETRRALLAGIRFFQEHSRHVEDRGSYVVYPGSEYGKTGTPALVALSEIEFLRTEPEGATADEVRGYLRDHLDFLLTVQLADGRFHGKYLNDTGEGEGLWSPYYDGETMLALAKAAVYLGREDLIPAIMRAAEGTWQSYVVVPAMIDDNRTRSQFYQWGTMAYSAIYQGGWEGSEEYAQRVIDMALWRMEGLQKLADPPPYNAAYAYEGLCWAREIARQSGDEEAQQVIEQEIRSGVLDLLASQVGNSQAGPFICEHQPASERAIGGCLLRPTNPYLRIDAVQHQAHAMLLTRRFLFSEP